MITVEVETSEPIGSVSVQPQYSIKAYDGEVVGVIIPATSQDECQVHADATVVVVSDAQAYEGEYSVTPKAEQQTLQTQNLLMRQNLTVEEIPFHRVSNTTGLTVIIA